LEKKLKTLKGYTKWKKYRSKPTTRVSIYDQRKLDGHKDFCGGRGRGGWEAGILCTEAQSRKVEFELDGTWPLSHYNHSTGNFQRVKKGFVR